MSTFRTTLILLIFLVAQISTYAQEGINEVPKTKHEKITCYPLIKSLRSGKGEILAEAEAENGELLGDLTVQTEHSGYSGTGYVGTFSGDEDQLNISIEVPEEGLYTLVIRYGGFWGTKNQDLMINGENISILPFPESSVFISMEAGTHHFLQGTNTVSIKRNWGYIAIDKISLTLPEKVIFNIDKDLVDPAADENAANLYAYLKTQFGERIISGQTRKYFSDLASLAGKTPVIKAGDLASYTEGYPYAWDNGHVFGAVDDGTVSEMIDWSTNNNGMGIVSLQWHWHAPGEEVAGINYFYTENTDFDIREAIKEGTEEYNLIIRDIDAIAVQLKRLEDAGVPVLWRPLHEAGGAWFWWGAHGPEACIELYTLLFQRLTYHHGLHNLIWVWSSPEADWYPGNHLVDIVGFDSYPGSYNYGAQKFWFDRLNAISEGRKLIAMTENGPIPDPGQCFEYDAPWLYFMSWSDLVGSQNETAHIQEVYNHASVITGESDNALWRSALYPDNWTPHFRNGSGQFLHDFSYAGYHQGLDTIPFIEENIIDITQAPYNADNTGTEDVTAAIQAALDNAGAAGGGVVYLPEGTYRIKETSSSSGEACALYIGYDNVVLRGSGPELTFLYHDQNTLRQKDIIHIRNNWSNWNDKRGTETLIAIDIQEPTKIIPVESVEGFTKGDLVVIRNDFTQSFLEEHDAEDYWNVDWLFVGFLRRIDSIDVNNRYLVIDAPTRYPLKTRDNARVYHAGEHISECGIEDLSIGNLDNPKSGWDEEDYSIEGTGAWDAHYSHAIHFKYAENCWVKNVSTYKPEGNTNDIHLLSNCLLMSMSRNITVDSCFFQKPQYEGGGGNGYMYTFSGNDCLIKNSRANHSRHNFDFKLPYCNGNVILNCKGENSKYSSDFHMYLSMANLIDGFTVNQDYLECAFRPYGGTVMHAYPSTQSVFYNTYGEAYHSTKEYIVDSRQFGDGYVIGTSGPAPGVKTTPVSGTQNGYDYNTSPEDMVEGQGKGENLRPVSLYLDQLEKRKMNTDPVLRLFNVKFLVKNAWNGELLEGCNITINEQNLETDSEGVVQFTNLPAFFEYTAEKENFSSISGESGMIYSDTTFYLQLTPDEWTVSMILKDELNLEPFWGVSITLGSLTQVTDQEGKAVFSVPADTYDYSFEKLSYGAYSGSLSIYSDTTVTILLARSEAYIKFKLKEEDAPVYKAWVSLGSDSIESNSLGIAQFEKLAVNETYTYDIRKENYKTISGSLFLVTDTTVNISMETDTLDNIHYNSNISHCWPNPAKNQLHITCTSLKNYSKLQLYNLQGNIVHETKIREYNNTLDISFLQPGVYFLVISTDDMINRHMFVKKN